MASDRSTVTGGEMVAVAVRAGPSVMGGPGTGSNSFREMRLAGAVRSSLGTPWWEPEVVGPGGRGCAGVRRRGEE